MAGRRHKSFRRGDVNEDLGVLLLKAFATVAPVPRPEDVGIDAVVTLLRSGPDQLLIAEDSFYVQIKSASSRVIVYAGHEIEWLNHLNLPLFIASVDLSTSSIELFSCQALSQALIEAPWKEIRLNLDVDERSYVDPVRFVNICPPALRWSTSDLASDQFNETQYPILKMHVQVEQKNCQLRSIRHMRRISWKTNETPSDQGFMSAGNINESDIARIFRDQNTLFATFISECMAHKDSKVLDALVVLRGHMRTNGFDPDPNGLCEATRSMIDAGPFPKTGMRVLRIGE